MHDYFCRCRKYLISTSDVSDWSGGQTFCTDLGYELVKWDTADKFLDCSYIASSGTENNYVYFSTGALSLR